MLENNGLDVSENRRTDTHKKLIIERRLLYYAHHPQFINHRMQQLERETSVEDLLENSSIGLSFIGTVLGVISDRKWLLLSLLSVGLLFLKKGDNEIQKLLQKQGYRSTREIQREQRILQALRGDYDAIGASDQVPEDRIRQIINSLDI